MSSPFQCGGTATSLPAFKVPNKTLIRVEQLSGATVYIKIRGTATASDADYFLGPGDAIEIPANKAPTTDIISLINAGTNPKIFWSLE